MQNSFTPFRSVSQKVVWLGTALGVAVLAGCSSGVAPSKTASGAGTGALIGGAGGAAIGSSSSMGTGTGLLGGAALGALTGGIVGMVQDARDRKEQDRLSQERAYQQGMAKSRAEEAKLKASMEEELAIAEGFRISDIELNDAQKKLEMAQERLKKLQGERTTALAKKKSLDEAHEKTLSTEAEIARLEEELARLKGDEAVKSLTDEAGQKKREAPGTPTPPPGVKAGF
ncbi:MAG: hypothetical protein HY736_01780 [Verrucomicrobia bacterium]|nr:hypothetical protein [Verrucomicrobiota bacterium]